MVTAAIGDADSSVRATARRAYWVLRLRFPDFAEAVMNSLAPSMQVGSLALCAGFFFSVFESRARGCRRNFYTRRVFTRVAIEHDRLASPHPSGGGRWVHAM